MRIQIFSAMLCTFSAILFSCITTSCGITPLYNAPFGDKPEEFVELIDRPFVAELLKAGKYTTKDGDTTLEVVEYKELDGDHASLPVNGGKIGEKEVDAKDLMVRLSLTTQEKEEGKEKAVETTLPLLLLPFRYGENKDLFAIMTIDNSTLVLEHKIYPMFLFMERPYFYILKLNPKDTPEGKGINVQFVQFATVNLTKATEKVTDKVLLSSDDVVMNTPSEIMEMLKNPENYKLAGDEDDFLFMPVKK